MQDTSESELSAQDEAVLKRLKAIMKLEYANVLADMIARCFFADRTVCKNVLRIVTGNNKLTLVFSKTQYDVAINGLNKHVTFDLFAIDSDGNRYDLEFQRDPRGATIARVREYRTMMHNLEWSQGRDPTTTKDYVIFFCERDPRHQGQLVYVDDFDHQYIDPAKTFDHDIFVNCAYCDDSDNSLLAMLVHDLNCSDAADMKLPFMAARMRWLKETPQGQREMDEELHKFIEEVQAEERAKSLAEKIDSAKQMLLDGLSLKKVASYARLPLSEVESLRVHLQTNS